MNEYQDQSTATHHFSIYKHATVTVCSTIADPRPTLVLRSNLDLGPESVDVALCVSHVNDAKTYFRACVYGTVLVQGCRRPRQAYHNAGSCDLDGRCCQQPSPSFHRIGRQWIRKTTERNCVDRSWTSLLVSILFQS